jgi:hypothetical protein
LASIRARTPPFDAKATHREAKCIPIAAYRSLYVAPCDV